MKQYELVNFCEFDPYAIKSYCAIHNIDESLNLGDITKIDIDKLPQCSIITHGSPCQDFSISGKQMGAEIDSKTRSSLMWNSVEIIKKCNPSIVVWENVKNVLSDKHKHSFNKYINVMDEIGYNSYYEVLIGTDYNIPQVRERIICVSIKKEIDTHNFTFEKPEKENINFYNFLDNESTVDNKYYKLNYFKSKSKYSNETYNDLTIYKLVENKDKVSKRSDGNIYTLTASGRNCGNNQYIATLGRVLTPCESLKLMGFSEEDFQNIKKAGVSDTKIYKQAGNSIIVDKIYFVFKRLYELFPNIFNSDMKYISLFSGIGAFEKGLDRLYEDINSNIKL